MGNPETSSSERARSAQRAKRALIRLAGVTTVLLFAVQVGLVGWLQSGAKTGAEAIAAIHVWSLPDDITARMGSCDYHWLVLCTPWKDEIRAVETQIHRKCDPLRSEQASIALLNRQTIGTEWLAQYNYGECVANLERPFAPAIPDTLRARFTEEHALLDKALSTVKSIPHLPDAVIFAIGKRFAEGILPGLFMSVFVLLCVLVPPALSRGNLIVLVFAWPLLTLLVLGLLFLLQGGLWLVAEGTNEVLTAILYLSGGVLSLGRDGVDAVREISHWKGEGGEDLLDRSQDSVDWSHRAEEAGEIMRREGTR